MSAQRIIVAPSILAADFGHLADDLDRVVDRMAVQVGDAADRDFRRWPQFPPRDNSYGAEIALLKDFLHRRVAWIKSQLDTNF